MNKLLFSFMLLFFLPLSVHAALAKSEINPGDILVKFKPGTLVMNFTALQVG